MENLRAISCVTGAVLINLTFGTFYSFGNIVPYVASYMRNNGNPTVTSEHGTWLTAAFLFGQGLSSVLGSYIEQWFNSRTAVIVGCFIHSLSTFLTIWAVKFNFTAMIVIYGFGSGFGSGCSYMASIIAAQKWFPSRKGLFTGVIVAGFGFGGLIFTNLQTLYMNPNNVAADSAGYFDEEVYKKVPNLFLYMGLIFAIIQTIGCSMAFSPQSNGASERAQGGPRGNQIKSPLGAHQQSEDNQNRTIVDEGLPAMRSALSMFKSQIFYFTALMMILVAPGVTFVNSLGKRYGQSFIEDDRYLATVVALAAIANAGGRLTWGFLVDRFTFSSCFTFKCVLFASLIVLFPFEFILSSKYMYLIWMFGMFFGFSGAFVLFPVFVEQVFGSRYGGMTYGILFIGFALASIFSSFVIQVTVGPSLSDPSREAKDKFFVRFAPCAIIAFCYCLSCFIYFTFVPVRRVENAIKRRREIESIRGQKRLFNRSDLFPTDRGQLAEKTAQAGNKQTIEAAEALKKDNSLGSIVKYNGMDDGRVKAFGQTNTFKVI